MLHGGFLSILFKYKISNKNYFPLNLKYKVKTQQNNQKVTLPN